MVLVLVHGPGAGASPSRSATTAAVPAGLQERPAQLQAQWGSLRRRCQEREQWLRDVLPLAERFWQGLAELAVALSDTQHVLLALEDAGGDTEDNPEPDAIRARLRSMQVLAGAEGSAAMQAVLQEQACSMGSPMAQAVPQHGQTHGTGSAAAWADLLA